VSAFRRPGAEIKEGLIPVNMFFVSQSLTENLSMEAFYQLEWEQTVVDNCGTFFSQVDVAADGCDDNLRLLSNNIATVSTLNRLFLVPAGLDPLDTDAEGNLVVRGDDRDARDDGQWGLAFRYFYEPLDTEFGAYAMNYHSRAPILSATAPSQSVYNVANRVLPLSSSGAALAIAGNSEYFIEYPEDIRLYGLSFSTTLPTGTAWSGEISYRPNAPVALNTTDVLYSAVRPINNSAAANPYADASVLSAAPGATRHGYNRKEVTQIQTTFTHFFDQVMGASRLTLVGEAGMTFVGGLEHNSDARYGRDPVFGPGELPNGTCERLNNVTIAGAVGNADYSNATKDCNDNGFTTHSSWGYRARAIWDYPDVFAGVNLRPSIAWSHDVDGYSPGPGANFEEGRKAVSLGLEAEYQNTYTANLSYTDFFGGDYNTQIDRDFVAFSVGASF